MPRPWDRRRASLSSIAGSDVAALLVVLACKRSLPWCRTSQRCPRAWSRPSSRTFTARTCIRLDEAAAYQQLIEDFQLHPRRRSSHGVVQGVVAAADHQCSALISASARRAAVWCRDGSLSSGARPRSVDDADPGSAGQARPAGADCRRTASPCRPSKTSSATDVAPDSEPRRVRIYERGDLRRPPAASRPVLRPATPTLRPPGVLELEELLATHLNMRVSGSICGQSTVASSSEFATLEDLERIYRLSDRRTVELKISSKRRVPRA